jgi:site-specific DNA-cytosine methylase
MKVVELFAGVGGFRLGLERAGHEVVWANEWDKYAATTYDKNFGGSIDRRDITTIPAGDVPAHDLIVGGFPCQSFSVAGKRRGFDEVRGTLFARGTYIKQLNPGVPQDYRLYDTTGIAPTINPAAAVGGAVIPKINTLPMRKLTPVECERLQGFPDNWTQGVSDTQRYKQMGNAVTVNVIEAVARMLPAPQSTGEQR